MSDFFLKIVIILNGRYAGKKAVIVNTFDSEPGKFGHALVAGLSKAPKRVAKNQGLKKIAKRSTLKPFVKLVNYNHLMPTRCVCPPSYLQMSFNFATTSLSTLI